MRGVLRDRYPDRYPLEAVERLQAAEEERAAAALAARLAQAASADASARELERAAGAARRTILSPDPADASAADLQAAARRRGRLHADEQDLATRCAEARRLVQRASEEVERARAVLAEVRRERQALADHRSRWERARRKARDAADEAATEDGYQAILARRRDRD